MPCARFANALGKLDERCGMVQENRPMSFEPLSYAKARLSGNGFKALLARGALGALTVKIGGAGLSFLLQILLARLLGAEPYGIYVYALGWLNILVMLAVLGFDGAFVRYIAAYRACERWELLVGILKRGMGLAFLNSLILAGLGAGALHLLRAEFSPEQILTFQVALALLPVLALSRLRAAALRACKAAVKAEAPDAWLRPALLAAGVGLFYLSAAKPPSAHETMAMNLLAASGAFALGGWLLRRTLPPQARGTQPNYRTREWIATSIPLLLIAGMQTILNQTDVLMLGALLGPAEAGVFSVAARVSELTAFGLFAINAIAAPMIAEFHHAGRKTELQRTTTLAARGSLGFTLLAGGGLALLGEWILGMFGSAFQPGYAPLLILLCGQLVNSACGSVALLMTMTGGQNQALAIIGAGAALNVALNASLIPRFGLPGAALATATSLAAWNLGMLVRVYARFKINPTAFGRIAAR
jgi:O-antigen/teichoic acid export membrane protein